MLNICDNEEVKLVPSTNEFEIKNIFRCFFIGNGYTQRNTRYSRGVTMTKRSGGSFQAHALKVLRTFEFIQLFL